MQHTCMHTHTHMHATYMNTRIHAHIHIHTYTHTHITTYTHTHTYTPQTHIQVRLFETRLIADDRRTIIVANAHIYKVSTLNTKP